MGRTVAELERTISERELNEWMALDLIDPFGEARTDAQMAILASAIFNAAGVTRQGDKRPFGAKDFLPLFDFSDKQPQDINRAVRAVFGAPAA